MEAKSYATNTYTIPLLQQQVIPIIEITIERNKQTKKLCIHTTNKESWIDPLQEAKQKGIASNGKNKPNKTPSGFHISTKSAQMTIKCSYCLKDIDNVIINNHIASHPSKILEWLYLGSYNNAANKKELEYANIKCILNCAQECKNLFESNFKYKHIPMSDVPDFKIIEYFEDAIKFLEEARVSNSNVLVHCQLGKSRSASVVIAYLMKMMNFQMEDAYKYVKKIRKIAFPNLGFMQQLREYEKMIQESKVN